MSITVVAGDHWLLISEVRTSSIWKQGDSQSWHILQNLGLCFKWNHQDWSNMHVKEYLQCVGPSLLHT